MNIKNINNLIEPEIKFDSLDLGQYHNRKCIICHNQHFKKDLIPICANCRYKEAKFEI